MAAALHPDGDSARVRVEETDLLGRPTMESDLPGVVLSLAGIRRLREIACASQVSGTECRITAMIAASEGRWTSVNS